MSADHLTFIHRFSRNVSVTMRVRDCPPEQGSMLDLRFEWVGRPKPKHVNEYRQWILATLQILCDRWEKSILYCLGTSANQTEIWHFEPGRAPKLAEKLNVGIP